MVTANSAQIDFFALKSFKAMLLNKKKGTTKATIMSMIK